MQLRKNAARYLKQCGVQLKKTFWGLAVWHSPSPRCERGLIKRPPTVKPTAARRLTQFANCYTKLLVCKLFYDIANGGFSIPAPTVATHNLNARYTIGRLTPPPDGPSPSQAMSPSNLQWSLWRLAEVRYNRHGPPPVSNHTGPPGSGLMAPQRRIDV